MVLNAAVQMLREADELKQKLSKFKSGTSMLQDRNLWSTQQQLQKIYQKVLVLDLDYALDKKVEQDLWNIGFKQQIEALQAISKDRKNPLRSEGQAMLSWVLQAAAGFYLCLLHQICTTFKLDLPFRRRSSLLGWVESWGAGPGLGPGVGPAVGPGVGPDGGPGAGQDAERQPPPAAARYACQHVLVHLGDLARYRHQLRVAYTFYRHALVVSAHSGQPYNQLALVSWRRGRRLGAVYWHVRSLMVRAPFPPAPANLARTLTAAQPLREHKDLPVLPGLGAARTATPAVTQTLPLDAHSYVTELIQALHLIHNLEELERAAALVNTLNSSLSALVATDSFEAMTLIKMACVVIWLVHSSTEDLRLAGQALSEPEARAAGLAHALASGALLALLLPNYTLPQPLQRPLPAVKVWLQWTLAHEASVEAWEARPALWPALAHTLTMLAHSTPLQHPASYATVPLAEDAELQGFVPLEEALADLNFAGQAAWDSTGPPQSPSDMSAACLRAEPELERRVRAHRLVQLGRRLAQRHKDHLSYTEDEGGVTFTAAAAGGEQLSNALAELRRAGGAGGAGDTPGDCPGGAAGDVERDDTSDDERTSPPPPVIISEADFREKVREKRIGILKPQGSLERAREERALALTQEDMEPEGTEEGKGEDRREPRRARVNIAMAAIMRKQEETNKQVKFVTPPPTPESTPDVTEQKEDRPKVIQPKAIKSLANLPVGKKIGGILSLKDKSGYPHLVNIEEPKKVEKEEKKASQPTHMSQNSQTYPQKRHELPSSPNWTNNPPVPFNEAPRMTFQKNYGIQNTGISYNPTYPPSVNNQGIRLPVVNPKEIDVRTAALQKQNSRQDLFQDGPKFPHGYQISGDKKNFLNDLPPRFANQYRYWQTAQENQFNDNKFRDDKSNSLFDNQARSSWSTPDQQYPQQQMPWWKPENPPNFNANYNPMNIQPNYFANVANPYQNAQPYPMQGQSKPESLVNQNYMQSTIGQPQMPNVQNLVPPNFNPMNNFSYPSAVGYDSAMYPQFSKLGYQPMQMKTDLSGLNFGLEQRNAGFPEHGPDGQIKPLEHMTQGGEGSSSEAGNTYSLFSGAPDTAAWGAPRAPHQSLWSGPGPSPLERLLEQQKQMKPPAPH